LRTELLGRIPRAVADRGYFNGEEIVACDQIGAHDASRPSAASLARR